MNLTAGKLLFTGSLFILLGLLLAFEPGSVGAQVKVPAIRLQPGPHLLIDDFLIEQSPNVVRRIESPIRDLALPVITAKEDHNFQPYVTVLRNPQSRRFRMWYGVPVDAGQSHLAYIESEDGVHWLRPHRVLDDAARINFGCSVLDEGPGFANAECRYKYAWYHGQADTGTKRRLCEDSPWSGRLIVRQHAEHQL